MINVTISFFGAQEQVKINMKVPEGSTMADVLTTAKKNNLFRIKDIQFGLYTILLNNKMVIQGDMSKEEVAEGDVITMFLPMAGG